MAFRVGFIVTFLVSIIAISVYAVYLAFHVLNPFLEYLLEMNESYKYLLDYASLKIDFFDLLNIPLLSFLKLGPKTTKIEVKPLKTRIGLIKTIFYGFVTIKIHTEGGIYKSYYPVNLHGPPIFGKNGKELLKHHCIPLTWELFDIEECKTYSRKDKRLKKTLFIHFDTSISILVNPSNYYFGYEQWKNALKKWQNYQYVEFRDFETLRELFVSRFVKGLRRKELFSDLGLKPVDYSHKNRNKRKYERKSKLDKYKLEPVDLDEYESKERCFHTLNLTN
jgi:hypothetical protein